MCVLVHECLYFRDCRLLGAGLYDVYRETGGLGLVCCCVCLLINVCILGTAGYWGRGCTMSIGSKGRERGWLGLVCCCVCLSMFVRVCGYVCVNVYMRAFWGCVTEPGFRRERRHLG